MLIDEYIQQWSKMILKESEEGCLNEDTYSGIDIEDVKGAIDEMNQTFEHKKLDCSVELVGKGADWAIKLFMNGNYSVPYSSSDEWYSPDGLEDAMAEKETADIKEAQDVVFGALERYLDVNRNDFEFVFLSNDNFNRDDYYDEEDSPQSFWKLVPKSKAKKLVVDAFRNLVDGEYNKLRKMPMEQRKRYFLSRSTMILAYMVRENSFAMYDFSLSGNIWRIAAKALEFASEHGSYNLNDFEKLFGIPDATNEHSETFYQLMVYIRNNHNDQKSLKKGDNSMKDEFDRSKRENDVV